MTKDEAQAIVIDVATKRKPHNRLTVIAAVELLEAKPVAKKKTSK